MSMTVYVDNRATALSEIELDAEEVEVVIASGVEANHDETLVRNEVKSNSVRFTLAVLGVLLALPFLSLAAQAQAFVSVKTGVDVGACAVTAPCRTIVYSLSQAVDGGTVNIVDSGHYEPFLVDKSVTVQAAPGVVAVVTRKTGGPGISIELEDDEHVTIRGLTLILPDNLFNHRPPPVSQGFILRGSGTAHIERCIVRGFDIGIDANMVGHLFIRETSLSGGTTGINLSANNSLLRVSIERCQALKNESIGLNVTTSPGGIIRLIVLESQFSGNDMGVNMAPDASGVAAVNFQNCAIVNNNFGLHAEGSGATARVSNSTISENGRGLSTGIGAALLSRGDNTVEGNSISGAFTGKFTAQ